MTDQLHHAQGWKFQRVITPGGVVAVVTVVAGILIWGVRVEGQLHTVANTQASIVEANRRQWDRITAQDSRIADLGSAVARIDARTEGMADQLDRIYSLLANERK